jgi:hypothetical protein
MSPWYGCFPVVPAFLQPKLNFVREPQRRNIAEAVVGVSRLDPTGGVGRRAAFLMSEGCGAESSRKKKTFSGCCQPCPRLEERRFPGMD